MIYVMSDIHGCYNEYKEMLSVINFNNNDILYVLGDVCDRGPDPMRILLDMEKQDNIIPIFGNHDVSAYICLNNYLSNQNDFPDRNALWWLADGGKTTLESFKNLSKKEQDKVMEYFEEFLSFKELNVNGESYVLVHGGLKDFDENKSLDEYRLKDLVWERADYNKVYFKDKIIISGHTPTHHIDPNFCGKIIKKNNHIAIDCGCVFGNNLGCICLDTLEEFYVERRK